jgi:hypothetical protein
MGKNDSISAESEPPAAAAPKDLVLVGDRVSESGGYRVLRQREDRLEVGELRAMREGKPLTGEVVRLHPTERHERVFECETLHEVEPTAKATPGPAQIATDKYRHNWDQIFGALADSLDEVESAGPVDVSKLN